MRREPLNSATTRGRPWLVLELILLFLVAPALLYFWAPLPILPVLWAMAGLCGRVLCKDPGFDRSSLWHAAAVAGRGRAILGPFAVIAVISLALVYVLAPRYLFSLIRQDFLLWLLIIMLYPLLSVYPQELIYRTYFFHRYRSLFPNRRTMIVLNAVLFGYMHLIFQNWIAIGLTTAGGFLFAATYDRTRSTLLVSLQHALYGCLVFTVGLGRFLYIGAVPTLPSSLRLFGG
jgi:membrane protease YdiL (CAAX protease family)